MCGFCIANNQFSDNVNNGAGLLSSVLLSQIIFTFNRWLEAEAYFRRRRVLFQFETIINVLSLAFFASFKYICYGSADILILSVLGQSLDTRIFRL